MLSLALALLLQATPDPLAVQSSAEVWLWTQSVYAPPAPRRDLAGGRFQGQAGWGRWGFGVRAESIGLPGQYQRDKPETFRAAQLHLAVHRNLIAIPGGITCGPAAIFGAAVALELQDGKPPAMPKAFTGGLGARCSGDGWWTYAVVGQSQALRGVAGIATAHARMSDRLAWVGDFQIGARGYLASIGVAVRAF
jgi:hypothetical protein